MVHLDVADIQCQDSNTLTINDLPNEILIYIFSMIDFESLITVAKVCTRWQQLCLTPFVWDNTRLIVCMKNYIRISESIVPFVAKYLKHVKLQYFKLYSQVRASLLSYCPNITHLEISISQVDSCIFDDLGNWPNLKFLSFRNSLIVHSESINSNVIYHLPFEKLKYLETLILSNFALTHNSLHSMLLCTNLTSINMEKMKNIPASFLESLLKTKENTLIALYIYGDTLNDNIMYYISNCKVLEVLHIMTCKTLFDSSLLHLYKQSHNLRSLKLRHGYFSTGALLAYFSNNKLQRLTYLSLSRCIHVTVQVAKAIKVGAPNLKELSFYLCPFIMSPDFNRVELEKLFNIQLLLD